jgi:hypothetical protein
MKLIFLLCSVLLAQTVTVDLAKLPSQARNEVINANNADKPVDVEKWAVIGKGLAQAIAECCKELSVGVNDFVRTPVGKITMLIIVWKMFAKDFLGCILWIAVTIVCAFVFRLIFGSRKVVGKDGLITYERRMEDTGDIVTGLTIATVVAWSITTIGVLVGIFG